MSTVSAGNPALLPMVHPRCPRSSCPQIPLGHQKCWADSAVTTVYQMWESGGFIFFSELVCYITKTILALGTKFKQDKRRRVKFTSFGPPDSLLAPQIPRSLLKDPVRLRDPPGIFPLRSCFADNSQHAQPGHWVPHPAFSVGPSCWETLSGWGRQEVDPALALETNCSHCHLRPGATTSALRGLKFPLQIEGCGV